MTAKKIPVAVTSPVPLLSEAALETKTTLVHEKTFITMSEGIIFFSIPIAAFIMVVAIRYLESKENMAMIEKGMSPAERRKRNHQANPTQTLKNGLLFVGAGLGLLLAIVITNMFNLNSQSSTGVFFALIAIFGGAGLLAAYLYERKNPPRQED